MLLGKHLVSTIWLYSSNVPRATLFYRDVLGLAPIEIAEDYAHFDAGGIRISIHHHKTKVRPRGAFYVFYVEQKIEQVVKTLEKRGLVLAERLREHPFGRATFFHDPDGHELWIWQPPKRKDSRFSHVEPLVKHYKKIAARLKRRRYTG